MPSLRLWQTNLLQNNSRLSLSQHTMRRSKKGFNKNTEVLSNNSKDELGDMCFSQRLPEENTQSYRSPYPFMPFYQSQYQLARLKKKRAISAKTYPTQPIEATIEMSNKSISIADQVSSRRNTQPSNIKWIGVHPRVKNDESLYRQAFPTRKHKSASQYFGKFMQRIGKQVYNEKQKIMATDHISPGRNYMPSRGASKKLKPRLTWYERKKPTITGEEENFTVRSIKIW